MATILDFTSYDEIRATLGVSDEELEDSTLGLPVYFKQLQFEFSDLSPTLEELYISLKALPSRSPVQQKLLDVVSVFSAYAISKSLLTSASLFAPKRITDGKAETDRIADPFKETRIGVASTYAQLRGRLLVALAAVGTEVAVATSRNYFGVAGLAINPVTGA